MVDILGLVVKIDIVLTKGIIIEIFEVSKIDEVKIVVPQTKVDKNGVLAIDVLKTEVANVSIADDANLVNEEGVYSLVYEVDITSINDVLS